MKVTLTQEEILADPMLKHLHKKIREHAGRVFMLDVAEDGTVSFEPESHAEPSYEGNTIEWLEDMYANYEDQGRVQKYLDSLSKK